MFIYAMRIPDYIYSENNQIIDLVLASYVKTISACLFLQNCTIKHRKIHYSKVFPSEIGAIQGLLINFTWEKEYCCATYVTQKYSDIDMWSSRNLCGLHGTQYKFLYNAKKCKQLQNVVNVDQYSIFPYKSNIKQISH